MSWIFDTARTAVDAKAASVMSKGFKYEPKKKVDIREQDVPFKMASPSDHRKLSVDLTGKRRGRLTVFGVLEGKTDMWCVRCDCGKYAIRRTKSLKKEDDGIDRCSLCQHFLYLRRDEFYRRTGKDKELSNFI